uniref:Uncharacterized protein n=1 Tax=Panagrolaimus sp. JU765 TaxID=591449 RepID=A0AC34QK60_9BILA
MKHHQKFNILNDNPGVLIRWFSRWAMSLTVGQQFDFYLLTFDTSYLIANNFRRDLLHVDNNETVYAFLGNCNETGNNNPEEQGYAIVLNKAAIKHLAEKSGDSLVKCFSEKGKICDCLDEIGLKSVNLSSDVNGNAKFMHITRHFTRGEMKITKEKLGTYNDGKEIFEKLSPDMIAFFDINPLEHIILDNFLYRLNKQEI